MAVTRPYCVSWSIGNSVTPRSVRDIQGGRDGAYPLCAMRVVTLCLTPEPH